jgi:hypothetical protein
VEDVEAPLTSDLSPLLASVTGLSGTLAFDCDPSLEPVLIAWGIAYAKESNYKLLANRDRLLSGT